jgi:hypothetical protein
MIAFASPEPLHQVKTVVMINCGALVELRAMLQLSSDQRCYVLDCHRPFHHTNVHSLDQVCVGCVPALAQNKKNANARTHDLPP